LLRLLRSSKKTNVMPTPNGRQDAQGIATDRLYRSKSRANGRVHGDDEQRRYRSEIERGEIASTLPSITDLTEQTGLAVGAYTALARSCSSGSSVSGPAAATDALSWAYSRSRRRSGARHAAVSRKLTKWAPGGSGI
jgi:hypothetical protein